MEERIKYLESLLPSTETEDKHWDNFTKFASYLGNGIFEWRGFKSTNSRELFLMGVLHREKIKFKEV